MNPVLNFLGAYGGKATNLWGGFVGDIGLVGVIAGVLRKHNCEVHRCPRLGRHTTAAGHKVCRKHHPDDRLTHQDVKDAHKAAKGT